ncbi:MAG: hypothetical protein M0R74_18725 [Dehalococcoidia bacterium]|nr:hypothetical protein [Dehalococcoidia bacterium]
MKTDTGILLEYTGTAANTMTFKGQATGTLYRFGNNPGHKRKYVYAQDAPGLLALRGQFRELKPEAKPEPKPEPVKTENTTLETEVKTVTGEVEESPVEVVEPEPLSVRQLEKVVPDKSPEELALMLAKEKSGLNRKTAIELIEKAIKAGG